MEIVHLYLNPSQNHRIAAKTIAETGTYLVWDRHQKPHYEVLSEDAIIHYDFATYTVNDFLEKFYYSQKEIGNNNVIVK